MSRRFYKTSGHFFPEKIYNLLTKNKIDKHFLTQDHHTFAGFLALNVLFQSILIKPFILPLPFFCYTMH